MTIKIFSVFLFIYFSFFNFSYSQESQNEYAIIVDSIMINNDLLVNGRFYYEPYPNAKGSSYFLSDNWQKGWLHLEGIKFEDIQFKLDILKDKLVLKQKGSNNNEIIIELNSALIDSFKLGNHLFVRNLFPIDKNYVELIYSGDHLNLYKTHQKFFKKIYDTDNPYGQITEKVSDSYLSINGKLTLVNKRKDLLEIISKAKRKQIKSFLKKNRIKYKRATNKELSLLMRFYEEL